MRVHDQAIVSAVIGRPNSFRKHVLTTLHPFYLTERDTAENPWYLFLPSPVVLTVLRFAARR